MTKLWLLLGALALVGGAGIRLAARTGRRRPSGFLDDDAIRAIETHGVLHVEDPPDPLDLEEIQAAEEDFWKSEAWEDPEEY